MPLPTYDEELRFLDAHANLERAPGALPGTVRMRALLARLGDPHRAAPALHIAGTKGKGSTAHLAARLLAAGGRKVGLYVSPHVSELRERIQVAGRPISENAFADAAARVRHAAGEGEPPTWFELLTAIAFVAFAEAGVEAQVLEVGLGGRLDATNLEDLPTGACAITPLSLDHVEQLGGTLAAIAGEKAGILKPGVPAVFGLQAPEAAEALRARAAALGVPVRKVGHDLLAVHRDPPPPDAPEAPQRLDLATWRSRHFDVPLPLLGEHQAANAALALGLVEAFRERRGEAPVDTAALRHAWREISIPGRIEVLARRPWVIADGAHNPASAWALGETLTTRFSTRRRALVLSIARDKDIPTILRILVPLAGLTILTTIDSPRRMDLETVAERVRALGGDLRVEPDPRRALDRARDWAGPEGLVCVAGSFYLAGELRDAGRNE